MRDISEAIFAEQPDEEHLADYLPWPGGRMSGDAEPALVKRLEGHLGAAHPMYLSQVDYGTDSKGAYGLNDAHREAHYWISRLEAGAWPPPREITADVRTSDGRNIAKDHPFRVVPLPDGGIEFVIGNRARVRFTRLNGTSLAVAVLEILGKQSGVRDE